MIIVIKQRNLVSFIYVSEYLLYFFINMLKVQIL
uniref:Uncharacterized protein n=1 Tax=Ciona intestinalis TaxID=7719 RepID=H2XMR7_CIOIN